MHSFKRLILTNSIFIWFVKKKKCACKNRFSKQDLTREITTKLHTRVGITGGFWNYRNEEEEERGGARSEEERAGGGAEIVL